MKTLDVEDTLVRFQNLKKKDFKPAVLEMYKRRFRQAVSSYLAYLEDPGGWKPRTLERPAADRDDENGAAATGFRPSRREVPQTGIVEYPFPAPRGADDPALSGRGTCVWPRLNGSPRSCRP